MPELFNYKRNRNVMTTKGNENFLKENFAKENSHNLHGIQWASMTRCKSFLLQYQKLILG